MSAPTRELDQADEANRRGMASATWSALGTSAQLVVTTPDAMATARVAVERVLAEIDLAASRFRPDSEVVRLAAAGGRWTDVSPMLVRALRVALDAAAWSDGLVDPTVGAAIVDLGYDRTFTLLPADGPPVRVGVRSIPGWRQVELDEARCRVRVPTGTLLDLGATAKGMASDLAAAAARTAGAHGVLVSLGGDVAVAGTAPDGGWPVRVADLSDPGLRVDEGSTQTISLHAGGLATSSTRARRWRRGGSMLHHVLDPRTGAPAAAPWRTVSVAAATCAAANAASTAAVVVGEGAPRWLTERGLTARLVRVDGDVATVGGWPDDVSHVTQVTTHGAGSEGTQSRTQEQAQAGGRESSA